MNCKYCEHCGTVLDDGMWCKATGNYIHIEHFANDCSYYFESKKVEPTKIVMAELKTRYEQIDRLTHELKTIQSQYDEQTKAFETLLKKNAELMRENEKLKKSNQEYYKRSGDDFVLANELRIKILVLKGELSNLKESKTVYIRRCKHDTV